MGYTLDTFVAAMRCPACGAISPADDSTNMQTSIQGDPQLTGLPYDTLVDRKPLPLLRDALQQAGR